MPTNRDAPTFADNYYDGRSFQNLRQQGLDLRDVEFSQCCFVGCQFREAMLRRCHFGQCTFERCDLSMLKPIDCRFTDVRFVKSKLLAVDWTLAARPASLAFHGCILNDGSFQGLALPKLELVECSAREVDFAGANLTNASFVKTDLLGASFIETNLSNANFSYATNYTIDPRSARLKKATFTLPEALSLLAPFDIVLK